MNGPTEKIAEEEGEGEGEGRGVPPGTVYIGDEGVTYPGDGVAWIGDIIVDPDA